MTRAQDWILAIRPKTLIASFVPVLVGTAVASAAGRAPRAWIGLLAFLATALIQVGTNFVNDALDFKKGADTAARIGPRRITASGVASPEAVMRAAYVSFGLAALAGIPLVFQGGPAIVAIGLVSILFGYLYTGGPFPLAYVGLGDLFVLVFFGWTAVLGMQVLFAGDLSALASAPAWVAGTQIGLLASVLIAINNLRDRATDVLAGKRTLAVRFGESFSRLEISALMGGAFLLGAYWWNQGERLAALLPLLALPFAIRLMRAIWVTAPGAPYNRFLGQAAALELGFGFLLSIALFFRSPSHL